MSIILCILLGLRHDNSQHLLHRSPPFSFLFPDVHGNAHVHCSVGLVHRWELMMRDRRDLPKKNGASGRDGLVQKSFPEKPIHKVGKGK